ncbi:MAG TPA: glycosyltransferase family 2 protein, partial [Gemmataceae bacterium]|jgi:GT2 family glycosyltransferase|nr:glycosyltransferase family 2 protein [Gemmataceae bacterium]
MPNSCRAEVPSLSIVIPSHNRPDLLRRCLETVTAHAPNNTEILVVDDASTNAIVSRTAESSALVKTLRLPRQSGYCIAANRGIATATAPIVELLNDDTEVEAGWAEAALACFRRSHVVAVAPLVLQWPRSSDPRIDSAGDWYHPGGFARKRGHGQRLSTFPLKQAPVFGASASSAFYRRDWLLRVGGFPESFGSYFEDVDLAFRLRQAGGEIVFEPRSQIWHHAHASYGKTNRRLLELQSRNEELVFWRNTPLRDFWKALPLHAAVLFAKGLKRWQEGNLLPFLLGRCRALMAMPWVVSHRRRLSN